MAVKPTVKGDTKISLEGKIPPQNVEAEQSVLGSLLIDRDAIVKIAESLKPEHFYRPAHAEIYRSILTLYEKRQPADLVTVTDVLKKTDSLEEAGGASYLTNLVNSVPTSAHVQHYANIVKEAATKRALIATAAKMTERAFTPDTEAKDLLELSEQELFGISQDHLKQNFIPLKDALAESFDRLDELHKKGSGMRGVPTGFGDLDKKLSGLQDSTLVIVAARPSMGKSTLVMNIAQYLGVKEKVPVGVFSLEMSKEQLVDLMLASQSDVDAWKITTGNLKEEDFEKLSEAMGELAEAPIFIDDTPGISIMEMRTKARRLQMEEGLKLLIVDYLQLIHGRDLENRVQEVSEISQALKNLARELKIPVLACSQLSRAVESRQAKIPQLSDLRESGGIEQDADVVMFLYREDPEDFENVKLSIAKHRSGPLGEMDLKFIGERRRFFPVERARV
ncbi:MAG TPA: replicative DNA helicase [Candidatus Nanoarchaeia archaeon]|nr:replicative DNA helicase [uncultured archaeon]